MTDMSDNAKVLKTKAKTKAKKQKNSLAKQTGKERDRDAIVISFPHLLWTTVAGASHTHSAPAID